MIALNTAGQSAVEMPASKFDRVPAPHEVRIGAEGLDVIRTFGAPMASAYTVDSGHYFETYLCREERAQATIHFEGMKSLFSPCALAPGPFPRPLHSSEL